MAEQTSDPRNVIIYNLPAIKGVCMIGVVLIHVSAGFTRVPYSPWLTDILIFVNCAARFAVPLFTVLSAFYLDLNPRNQRPVRFYLRTLPYLAVPYIFYTLFYAYTTLGFHVGWKGLVLSLITPSAGYHLWFVKFIILFYLLHPFLNRWYKVQKNRGFLVIAAFAAQAAYLILLGGMKPDGSFFHEGLRLLNMFFPVPGYIGYIMAGYYLGGNIGGFERLLAKPATLLIGSFLWLAITACLWAYWSIPVRNGIPFASIPNASVLHDLLAPVMCGAAFATILAVIQKNSAMGNPGKRFVHSVGLHAYGVYFLHVFVLTKIGQGLSFGNLLGYGDALFYILQFLLTITVTLVIVRSMARMPWGVGKYLT
jgi:surface polysaccharide O-acyltransferase-like enzyme